MKKIMLCLLFISQCLISLAQDKKLLFEIGGAGGSFLTNNIRPSASGVICAQGHLRYPVLDLTDKTELDVAIYPGIGLTQSYEALFLSAYNAASIDYAHGNRKREYDYQRFGLVAGLGIGTAYSTLVGDKGTFTAGPEVNVGLRARFLGRDHFYRLGFMADAIATKTYGQTYLFTVLFSRPLRKAYSGGRGTRMDKLNINRGTYF
jgi:hypothetical protein